ncbi:MAG: glycosyltransferase family 2 protein [Acutalibacteraceae bacterium]
MKELISVIVPVFNGESYLARCVDSLLCQTLENFELILVDDGSSDGTAKMCDDYAKKDGRVRVIHKSNGGLSDARNAGMRDAKGEYYTFIDSDDTVKPDYLEYLAGLIDRSGCLMAICGHEVVCADGKILPYDSDEYYEYDSCKAIEMLLYHDVLGPSAWAKIYHKSLFESIEFPVGKLYEDIAVIPLVIDKAGRIANGRQSKYYYIMRENSIVNQSFNPKKLELIDMTDEVCEKLLKLHPSLSAATLRRRVYARFSTLNQMLDVKGYDKEKREIIDFIKRNSKSVMSDPRAPKRDKIGILVLRLGFGIYRFFWRSYERIYK